MKRSGSSADEPEPKRKRLSEEDETIADGLRNRRFVPLIARLMEQRPVTAMQLHFYRRELNWKEMAWDSASTPKALFILIQSELKAWKSIRQQQLQWLTVYFGVGLQCDYPILEALCHGAAIPSVFAARASVVFFSLFSPGVWVGVYRHVFRKKFKPGSSKLETTKAMLEHMLAHM
jgi:hypothetical protein